jgi:hypothetical protein
MSEVAITMGYRHQPAARAPIDAGNLVADTGKADDYRYYFRVVEWCFSDPHMQETQQSSYSERSETMYVSRLTFHTTPGKTHEVEQELLKLMAMVSRAGGVQPRVLRSHLASPGAPDVVFEQEVADLETLTTQITQVTEREDFQKWSSHMSGLLTQSPKREVYLIVE